MKHSGPERADVALEAMDKRAQFDSALEGKVYRSLRRQESA